MILRWFFCYKLKTFFAMILQFCLMHFIYRLLDTLNDDIVYFSCLNSAQICLIFALPYFTFQFLC